MVNIIMSTYNGERFIKEQIDSILASDYESWRLFICDDCSSDSTVSIVEEYVNKYPDKIYLHFNNKNMGSTKNFLRTILSLSGNECSMEDRPFKPFPAEYYMCCDQDDVWTRDKINMTLRHMKYLEEKHGEKTPVLVFTDAVLVDEKLNYIKSSFFKTNRLNTKKTDLAHMLIENKCIGCTTMFNAALTGYLTVPEDGIRYHDWWLALIASSFGVVDYLPLPTLLYRQHSSNQVGQTDFKGYVRNRIEGLSEQKKVIKKTIRQARLFYRTYGKQLDKKKRRIVADFAGIYRKNFIVRRIMMIKNSYFKSGIIRNIGVMLVL